jgi:hypothetical protein
MEQMKVAREMAQLAKEQQRVDRQVSKRRKKLNGKKSAWPRLLHGKRLLA